MQNPQKNNTSLKFTFRVVLHIDDRDVLEYIQKTLGVGTIHTSDACVTFAVQRFEDIVQVIIPIFDTFPLQTTKVLDYKDWRTAAMIKFQGPLSKDSLAKILLLKAGMNQNRKSFDSYCNHTIEINALWLLGFVEGEATFGIKHLAPYFSIAQKANSARVLYAIEAFLRKIPLGFTLTKNSQYPIGSFSLRETTAVISCSWSNIDSLHDYILPGARARGASPRCGPRARVSLVVYHSFHGKK